MHVHLYSSPNARHTYSRCIRWVIHSVYEPRSAIVDWPRSAFSTKMRMNRTLYSMNGCKCPIKVLISRIVCPNLIEVMKNRRALLTERAWILHSWLLKRITGQTQRTLQLVPTRPCMHPAPSVIATPPPSHARPIHHSIQSHYVIT